MNTAKMRKYRVFRRGMGVAEWLKTFLAGGVQGGGSIPLEGNYYFLTHDEALYGRGGRKNGKFSMGFRGENSQLGGLGVFCNASGRRGTHSAEDPPPPPSLFMAP